MVLHVRHRIARSRSPPTLRSAADSAPAGVDRAQASSCPATALQTLGRIATRVYAEGISSERTVVALRLIEKSAPLRTAVEANDPVRTAAAAQALLATGHMTDL